MDEELDVTKLKYALYARKSTDDPERQARSIPDQIGECRKLAKRLGLTIVGEPIVETKSAKKPGRRPLFRQLLKDIRAGVYDGILAWNPDRLARNMKEGGEVIDMIDEDQIKDLKFCTHHFTKDANGLMLLGMAFVLSKQYSDKLSADVTRGMHRKVTEGRSHIPKHGYVTDDLGKYQPDGKNFELIQEAWQMRLRGESLDYISDHINSLGYFRLIKSTGRKVKMGKRRLSEVFKDPFYYGVLKQGSKTIDLRTKYDFMPAVSEADFITINSQGKQRLTPINTHKDTFYPFKAFVRCSFCDSNMYVAPSKGGSGKRYLNFRCDNDGCIRNSPEQKVKRKNRDPDAIKTSLRANIVLKWMYDFMNEGLNFTEEDYQIYLKQMTDVVMELRAKFEKQLHSLQGTFKAVETEAKETALGILNQREDSVAKKYGEERLRELETQKAELTEAIKEIKEAMPNVEQNTMTLESFLNFSKNAGWSIKKGIPELKYEIARIVFLNLWVDDKNVLNYQLNEPYATLLKDRVGKFSRGLFI